MQGAATAGRLLKRFSPFRAETLKTDDPKEFLESAMTHPGIAMEDRIAAAKSLRPYTHERLANEGNC